MKHQPKPNIHQFFGASKSYSFPGRYETPLRNLRTTTLPTPGLRPPPVDVSGTTSTDGSPAKVAAKKVRRQKRARNLQSSDHTKRRGVSMVQSEFSHDGSMGRTFFFLNLCIHENHKKSTYLCRCIYHTWILWVSGVNVDFYIVFIQCFK